MRSSRSTPHISAFGRLCSTHGDVRDGAGGGGAGHARDPRRRGDHRQGDRRWSTRRRTTAPSWWCFPECFVSLYPSGAWAATAASWFGGYDELWERMWASSVDVDGPLVDRLAKACAERGVHLAIGVNEREDDRPGLAVQHAAGHRTRRACCTATASSCRRCTSGCSTASARATTSSVVDLPGRPGRRAHLLGEPDAAGPLARVRGRPADLAGADRRRQRRLARLDAPHRHRVRGLRRQRPPVHPARPPSPTTSRCPSPRASRSSAAAAPCIVESTGGKVIAGPLYDEEGIVVADCDLRDGLHAKR